MSSDAICEQQLTTNPMRFQDVPSCNRTDSFFVIIPAIGFGLWRSITSPGEIRSKYRGGEICSNNTPMDRLSWPRIRSRSPSWSKSTACILNPQALESDGKTWDSEVGEQSHLMPFESIWWFDNPFLNIFLQQEPSKLLLFTCKGHDLYWGWLLGLRARNQADSRSHAHSGRGTPEHPSSHLNPNPPLQNCPNRL